MIDRKYIYLVSVFLFLTIIKFINPPIIQKISFITDKELVLIDITANAFLLNMVRIIIGTLLLVGRKEIPYSDMKNILEAKDRRLAGKTAPSSGLYFLGPSYPRKFNIPVQNNNLSEL